MASINTIENEFGVGAISHDNDLFVLATLDTTKGHVRVENFYTNEIKRGHMHDNFIVMLEVSFNGNFAASASELGTVIRVFDTRTLNLLHELRRGTSVARITSISFSPECNFLLATSNKSTVHIWSLKKEEEKSNGIMSKYLPSYFQSKRSYFKLHIQPEALWSLNADTPAGPVGTFVNDSIFFVAHLDGNLYQCRLTDESVLIEKQDSYLDKDDAYRVEA